MSPVLREGEKVLLQKQWFFVWFHLNDIVAFFHPNTRQFLIKKIEKLEKDKVWVVGINKENSTDSRDFGWIKKKDIIGRVIFQKS